MKRWKCSSRLAGSPRRHDLMFMLAQLYLRKQDFKAARQLIDKIISNGDADVRQRAQRLLTQLVSVEEQLARIDKLKEEQASYSRTGSRQDDSSETTAQTSIERPSIQPPPCENHSEGLPPGRRRHRQAHPNRLRCKGYYFCRQSQRSPAQTKYGHVSARKHHELQ